MTSPVSPPALLPYTPPSPPSSPPPPSPSPSPSESSANEDLFYQFCTVRKDLGKIKKQVNKLVNLSYFAAAHCGSCHFFSGGMIVHNGTPHRDAKFCIVPTVKVKRHRCFCYVCAGELKLCLT